MYLTENETDKLVHILNHLVKEKGHNPREEGFDYDENGNIFTFNGYDTVDLESGLDFLMQELGIE